MSQIPYIFNQLCMYLDRDYFEFLVNRDNGNYRVKTYSCWNHLRVMIWAQLSSRVSLRDLECSLRGHSDKLYRLGIGANISRNAIAHANASRPVSIYRDFASRMMQKASMVNVVDDTLSELCEVFGIKGVFAVDSSTVTFSLGKFPWSVPQDGVGGIKLHVLLDILRNVPLLALLTGHEERDQTFMSDYPYKAGGIYVFDKAYVKTVSMAYINKLKAFFILRRRENMTFEKTGILNHPSHELIYGDHIIRFTSRWARQNYPEQLRMVEYYSPEKNEILCFLSNNFTLPPEYIALIYRERWNIELFFRWIKQHLRITEFLGTSANAVHLQIYTAITAYCLLALAVNDLSPNMSTYEFGRSLSTAMTEKLWIAEWVKSLDGKHESLAEFNPQLRLFNDF